MSSRAHAERQERRHERLVGVEQRAVEVEDREPPWHPRCHGERGSTADCRSERPRNSPDPSSSSQRAPQARHWHESTLADARYSRSTSYEQQYGQPRCGAVPNVSPFPPCRRRVPQHPVGLGAIARPPLPCAPMIDYEVKGRVALLTLNRPDARNAINRQVAQEMEAAIDSMEADDEVWVGVLRAVTVGDKPTFCSGQRPQGHRHARGQQRHGQGWLRRPGQARAHEAAHRRGRRAGARRAAARSCSPATSSWPARRRRSGWPRSSATWSPAPAACSGSPRHRPGNVAMEAILTGEPACRPSGPTSSAWSTSSCEPDQVEAAALALADKICQNAPLAIWASRKVVLGRRRRRRRDALAADQRGDGGRHEVRGPQGGAHRPSSRSARPEWKGR